jgi:phage-related protein
MSGRTVGEAWVAVYPDMGKFGPEAESGVRSALGGVAKVVGAVFAASKAKDFVADIIGSASDLNENISKVTAVFGKENLASIQTFGSAAATAIGQSRNQALGAVGTFGNLLTAMGLSSDSALTMSTGMTALASDLASFNNTSVDDALLALRSGLTGETEPLKRFGVNLNEATLKQKAMEMGLYDGKGALDAGAKAQASFALIMEQTTTAQGDFARTSDGLANKQRILGAQFDNVKAQLGSALLPAAIAVTSFFADNMGPAFEKVQEIGGRVVEWIRHFAETWRDHLPEIAAGLAVLVALFVAWAASAAAAAVATLIAAAPFILIGLAIAGLAAAFVAAYEKWAGFREVVQAVVDWIVGTAWPALQAAFQTIIQAVTDIATWWEENWRGVLETVVSIWEQIVAVIMVAVDAIAAVISDVIAVILVAWSLFGDDILAYATATWEMIRSVIDAAIRLVQAVIQTVMAIIRGDWSAAWEGVKGIISAVWAAILAIVQGFLGQLQAIIGACWNAITATASAGWAAISGVVTGLASGIVTFVKGVFDDLVAFFVGLPGRISGTFDGMFDGIGKAMSAAVGVAKSGWNAFARFWNGIHVTIPTFDTHIPGIGKIGGGSLSLPDLPTFHGGGVVPGLRTDEVLAILRGREAIFTPEQLQALADAGFGRRGGDGPLFVIEHAEFSDPVTVDVFAKAAAGVLAAEGIAA